MATTSSRAITIVYSGDTVGTEPLNAASNTASPGAVQIIALSSGANTITVPTAVGYAVTGCTIVPQAANVNALTLKGISGDTGIFLHLTDPTSIGIDPVHSPTFVINAAATTNIKVYWT